eukprot:CAMPEP_0117574458 /NCGR_PEP_ID=MMETSP0784-20121206/61596_1 /TAXON_ID=39447 /ORGANISM="" /LENGTH=55 /DNA_ID=CAMNT_0005373287 /DNA_START=27 /DNA_END=190 /DNA_ORIENTATION=+
MAGLRGSRIAALIVLAAMVGWIVAPSFVPAAGRSPASLTGASPTVRPEFPPASRV